MIKQCFEGFDAENLTVYLKKPVSKKNSSSVDIKVDTFSDSEELNKTASPVRINILDNPSEIIEKKEFGNDLLVPK